MTATWSAAVTQLPPAYLGQAYQAALPVLGVAASSATALALVTGDNGMPAGLAISADFVGIVGTPTGAASVGHAGDSPTSNQSGTGAYKFTLTNGATTEQFTIHVYAAQSDPAQRSDMSTAAQAALRTGTDQ